MNSKSSQNSNAIPKSRLNMGTSLVVGFGNATGDTILGFQETYVLTGKDGSPYYLAVTPTFDPGQLSPDLSPVISIIKTLMLGLEFKPVNQQEKEFRPIPKWVAEAKGLSVIRLDYVDIADLSNIRSLTIKALILGHVRVSDRIDTINEISRLTTLKYIVQDETFTKDEMRSLKSKMKDLVVLSEKRFSKLIATGEIVFE